MAKGFTDSKGNFRPTGNISRRSSREKTIEPTLPAKVRVANAPPDKFLTDIEPDERIVGEGFFKTMQGDVLPESMGKDVGIFESTPFKAPAETPPTPRGFDPSTEEFDVFTDQFGNVLETRSRDTDEAENFDFRSKVTHEGEQIIDQGLKQDKSSRSPTANPKEKFGREDQEEKENIKEHEERLEAFKQNDGKCLTCAGTGETFITSRTVKSSTLPTKRGFQPDTGFGKCPNCNGTGRS